MKFLVTFTIRDTFNLSEILVVQRRIGDAIQKILQSGSVKDGGVLLHDRSGYFVLESNTAEEILSWFAGIFDCAKVEVKPVVSFEALPKLFSELANLPH